MGNFDVLCCEHRNWLYKFIGHTAVIYKNDAGQLMVFESTSLNKFSGIKGVQLTPLGLWLQHYNGKVRWRKWVWEKDAARSLDAEIEFELFIQEYRGTSYPSGRKGAWLLFKAWWDSPFLKKFSRNPVTTAVIFCSHLVGMLFGIVGFLELSPLPASELVPRDFREDNYIDGKLRFGPNNMGHLAPEILIKG
jgi:hypothetical protein